MGILDGTYDGSGYSGLDPSSLYPGLLTPQQKQAVGMQQLIATLGTIGANSGPSRLPVPFGVAAGKGAVAGQQAGNQAAAIGVQGNLLGPEIQQKQLANQQARFALLRQQILMQGYLSRHPELGGLLSGNTSSYGSGQLPQIASPTPSPAAPTASSPAVSGSSVPPTAGGPPPAGPGVSALPMGAQSGSLFTPSQTDAIQDAQFAGIPNDVIAKQVPGPTDFMRSYQDVVNAPPNLKPLAIQKLMTAAGDRYQLMRNGWAYDRVNDQWMHMPDLGIGVTGGMDPKTGQISASVVPGAPAAIGQIRTAEEKAKAQFEPLTTYDAQGNEVIQPRTALAGAPPVVNPGLSTGLPPGTTGAQAAAGNGQVPMAFKNAAVPSAPAGGSVGTPTSLDSLTLDSVVPPGSVPQRPAPPPGAFFGAPNPGLSDMQKNDAERLAKYQNQAAEGQKIYQGISMLSGVLDRRLNTNKLAPLWTDLTNVAQGMGLSSLIPQNYDPNDAAEFDKVSTDMMFAALKQIPGQPRVAEIEGLRRANPNLTIPRATNAAILHAILANQQWMDKRSDLATQYATKYPGAPLGAFDAKFNAAAPLADVTNQVFAAARQAGWQFPGDKGTPSNPAGISTENMQKAAIIKDNFTKGMYGDPKSQAAKDNAAKQLRTLGFQ